MKIKDIPSKIWMYSWSITIIFNCFSVYARQVDGSSARNLMIINIIFALCGMLFGLLSLYINKNNVVGFLTGIFLYTIVILPYVYINYLNKEGYFLIYTLLLIPISFGTFLYSEYKDGRLFRLLLNIRNIVIIMASVSLFFWLFSSILYLIPFKDTITIEWGGIHQFQGFKLMYYDIQHLQIGGIRIARNSGIFVEPAVWGLILNFVYLVGTFFCNLNYVSIGNIIIGVTILSTTSTTNIIVFIIGLLINYIYVNNKSNLLRRVFIPFLLGLVLILGVSMLNAKSSGESYSFRMDDLRAGFLSFKDHVFIGNGFGNTTSVIKYIDPSRIFANKTGFSSGLLLVFIQGGLLLGIIYIFPLLKMMAVGLRSKSIKTFLFPILIIILLLSTMAQYTELDIMILIMCLLIPKSLDENKKSYKLGGSNE